MIKIVIVYLLALILAMFPFRSLAFDYDVDWPTSDKESHTLAITINGCETRFRILNKDFDAFNDNEEALKQAVQKALERANSGCKN